MPASTKDVSSSTLPTDSIYLPRYVYGIIFVFLRLCSSHQQLYTLTKYVRSNVKTTTTTTNWVGVCARGGGRSSNINTKYVPGITEGDNTRITFFCFYTAVGL